MYSIHRARYAASILRTGLKEDGHLETGILRKSADEILRAAIYDVPQLFRRTGTVGHGAKIGKNDAFDHGKFGSSPNEILSTEAIDLLLRQGLIEHHSTAFNRYQWTELGRETCIRLKTATDSPAAPGNPQK